MNQEVKSEEKVSLFGDEGKYFQDISIQTSLF